MPAPVVANASDRGDTRYDVSGLAWDPARGAYVDDQGWHYDSNGLSLDRPNAFDPSKPAQNQFDEASGTYSFGGGGGGGGDGSGGFDAYIRQLQSLLDAQGVAQKSDTRAAIQQALISYGVVPQGFKDELGALDDTTKALIQKNTDTGISGYARMLQDKQDAQRSMLAALSNKGLRRSGAKGFLGRRGQLEWDRKSADATAALLQSIGAQQKAFAEGEQQRKMQLMQALFSQQFSGPFRTQQNSGFPPLAPPTGGAPSFGAPAFQNQYRTGQVQPSGYSVNTGGGWYTNQQKPDQLTNKWQQLGKMG